MAPLRELAIVRLQGNDVRRFCNGMFTNNVRDLPVGGGQRTAACDAKGKLVGLMDLYLAEESVVRLVVEGTTFEDFEARYAKYVVFDDVAITDETAQFTAFTVQGPDAAAIVREAGLPVPGDGFATVDGVEVLRRNRGAGSGFDILAPTERAEGLRARLNAAGAIVGTWDDLERARVRAGRIRWPIDVPGRALVHELGSLKDEVLAFDKGCYIGQEVVHRVDVMGQVRKHLVGVRVAGVEAVPSGAELVAGDAVAGVLTSPIADGDDLLGLAVVRSPLDTPGTTFTVAGRPAVVVAFAHPSS